MGDDRKIAIAAAIALICMERCARVMQRTI